jgi:hypothetical protein
MKLEPVTSSQIESIGHDPATNTLGIKFKQGGTYHYANFTADDFAAFKSAESVGSHFHRNIKPHKDKWPYKKQ